MLGNTLVDVSAEYIVFSRNPDMPSSGMISGLRYNFVGIIAEKIRKTVIPIIRNLSVRIKLSSSDISRSPQTKGTQTNHETYGMIKTGTNGIMSSISSDGEIQPVLSIFSSNAKAAI